MSTRSPTITLIQTSRNPGFCNGLATTFEYIYRLEGRPPSEVPQRIWQVNRRGDCDAHNLKMHSERGKSAKTSCKYYLGLGLFSDLAESMGYEEYYEGLRRLYRLSLAVRESGGIMSIAEVRQAFPAQADIVEKHWSGNLNAPENTHRLKIAGLRLRPLPLTPSPEGERNMPSFAP